MAPEQGYLMIQLHAHLPYVRHPEFDGFLEESWFFEAVTECYLPLLDAFDRLMDDGVDYSVTLSLTPPLCEMLCDGHLRDRYRRHLRALCELVGKEVERTAEDPRMNKTAWMYHGLIEHLRFLYEEKYGADLVAQFRRLQDLGRLEIITCSATHGFLPLMAEPEAVRGQLRVARANYEKHFHRPPRGIWLPECAYRPGLDEFLAEEGIRFFFTDAHGILYGEPRPKFGIFAPVRCRSGVAAFGRDLESGKQVWSAQEGYPGDPAYREFYRDVAYDADYDYIRPFLNGDGIRKDSGIKYHRVTGQVELGAKELYDHEAANELAATHAGNFLFNRQRQARHLHGIMGQKPVIVSPYDAELFGHWWFEGPRFLEMLLRKIHHDQNEIQTITPSDYLQLATPVQVLEPNGSSWGDKGYYEVWLNGSNDWIYKHLHEAERRMTRLAGLSNGAISSRAARQAARELVLAQSSDWAFIMTMGTMSSYAVKRTLEHIHHFNTLYDQILAGHVDLPFLEELEARDNIFPEIDAAAFR